MERLKGTILIGMMGAGKSTLGLGLADHLGQRLVDTDGLIEDLFRTTCAEIIAAPDKDFPSYQAEAIMAYRPTEPEVVATGGSVPVYPRLIRHLAKYGVGIFIDVDPEDLQARLSEERIRALNNPKGLSFVDLYEERRGLYMSATTHTLTVRAGEPQEATLERLINLRSYIG